MIGEIVQMLLQAGVRLELDRDGALVVQAPRGALTEDLRSQIRAHTAAIKRWIGDAPNTLRADVFALAEVVDFPDLTLHGCGVSAGRDAWLAAVQRGWAGQLQEARAELLAARHAKRSTSPQEDRRAA